MSDLICQYSRDAVWQLKHDKDYSWKIAYWDESLDDGTEIIMKLPYGCHSMNLGRLLYYGERISDFSSNRIAAAVYSPPYII